MDPLFPSEENNRNRTREQLFPGGATKSLTQRIDDFIYGSSNVPQDPAAFLGPVATSQDAQPFQMESDSSDRTLLGRAAEFTGLTSADYGRVASELYSNPVVRTAYDAFTAGERAIEGFAANALVGETAEPGSRPYDWDLTLAEAYEESGLNRPLAELAGAIQGMGLPSVLDAVPGLSVVNDIASITGDASRIARAASEAAPVAAPALGLIAPGNLMRAIQRHKNVEFVPARVLAEAPGNTLRRLPEEMERLRLEIMSNPEGIDEPILVMFDQDTGSWHVAEGNHRVALAADENLPLPVVVMTGSRAPGSGQVQPASPEAIANIRSFARQHHNYVPSNLAASEIGLPVVPLDEVADYIDGRAIAGEVSDEDAATFRDFISTYEPSYMIGGTTPNVVQGTAEWRGFRSEGETPSSSFSKAMDDAGGDINDIDAWRNGPQATPNTSVEIIPPAESQQAFPIDVMDRFRPVMSSPDDAEAVVKFIEDSAEAYRDADITGQVDEAAGFFAPREFAALKAGLIDNRPRFTNDEWRDIQEALDFYEFSVGGPSRAFMSMPRLFSGDPTGEDMAFAMLDAELPILNAVRPSRIAYEGLGSLEDLYSQEQIERLRNFDSVYMEIFRTLEDPTVPVPIRTSSGETITLDLTDIDQHLDLIHETLGTDLGNQFLESIGTIFRFGNDYSPQTDIGRNVEAVKQFEEDDLRADVGPMIDYVREERQRAEDVSEFEQLMLEVPAPELGDGTPAALPSETVDINDVDTWDELTMMANQPIMDVTPQSIANKYRFEVERNYDRNDELGRQRIQRVQEEGDRLAEYVTNNYGFLIDSLSQIPGELERTLRGIAPEILEDDDALADFVDELRQVPPEFTRNPALEDELTGLLSGASSGGAQDEMFAGLPEAVLRESLPADEFTEVHLPFLEKFDRQMEQAHDYLNREIQVDLEFLDEEERLMLMGSVMNLSPERIGDLSQAYQNVLRRSDLRELDESADWFEQQLIAAPEEEPFSPSRIQEVFDVGDLPEQEVTSARTSIQQRRGGASAAPAVFTWLRNNRPLQSGSINLDIGGGRFDDTTDFVANEFGATNLVYDPFNRTPEHNQGVIDELVSAGGADTVTVSNVLNVIPEESNRLRVIEQAREGLASGGEAFFSVYPGNRSGEGAFTGSDQYQANMPIQDYLPLIEQVFGEGNVERRGNIIIATRP